MSTKSRILACQGAIFCSLCLATPTSMASGDFLRGDANGDGNIDLSDGVFLLNFLFLGGPEPSCKDAADFDDTGRLELTTPIYGFNWLFLGGPEPPAPGPLDCGPDPTEDELNCLRYDPCGTVGCLSNTDCPPGFYCEKKVGDCEGVGQCAPRPQGCPEIWDPVCGCDGQTYSNACEAAAAGVSVAHRGACPTDCTTNTDCPPGFYCEKPIGDCDGAGNCRPSPQICPDVWNPVCGCDGRTYGNACEAAAAGVSVVHEGECEPD